MDTTRFFSRFCTRVSRLVDSKPRFFVRQQPTLGKRMMLFSMMVAGILLLIASALFNRDAAVLPTFSNDRISVPRSQPYEESDQTRLQAGWHRIEKFCRLMDSLKRDPQGKYRYDSIMRVRPGLLDSAEKIWSHYKQLNHEIQ